MGFPGGSAGKESTCNDDKNQILMTYGNLLVAECSFDLTFWVYKINFIF